MFAHSKSDGNY